MVNIEALDNVRHQNLRVNAKFTAEFGDSINQTLVFPNEFLQLQREYPIFFRKDDAGVFQSVVLLGLDRDENLFLDGHGHGWNARYVPAVLARGPFQIGLRRSSEGGAADSLIQFDSADPRINEKEGEALFLPHGGNAPYLEYITEVLQAIQDGITAAKAMFDELESHQLIAPLSLEMKLSEIEQYTVPGLYSIDEERLEALDGQTLVQLNRTGLLRLCYMVLASAGNVNRLIELKRLKHDSP